ncbi:MAG: UDP-N-acetylmuramoyl-L-alanyl-D-glutamate--2,6-diaminopimelate ligase [Methylococcales bacterium]
MKLSELLEGFVSCQNATFSKVGDTFITGLVLDSRDVVTGNVFIALVGAQQHGLFHASQAILNGAVVIIYDPLGGGEQLAESIADVPLIAVDNLAVKLGDIAARYYGDPSGLMSVIGVTGTNGKTSCTQFLSQMLNDCGVVGTLGWGESGHLNKTKNTTPDALEIQRILSELLKNKKSIVAMEVSSHGLAQGRVNGVIFKGAVFTNISRDHLDYHGTMDDYLQAKLQLLYKPGLAFVVVNLDDSYCEKIIDAVPSNIVIWGVSFKGKTVSVGESVKAAILHSVAGIEFMVNWRDDNQRVYVPIYGDFNAENSLLVLTVMLAMGYSLSEAAEKLISVKPVTGRMQHFGGNGLPLVFVDYAHTPDALNKVISGLKKHCRWSLWVVFGCGGNRDKGKRPEMGAIAEQWADRVIITDDNPRFEASLDIVGDILAGCKTSISSDSNARIIVIQNRKQAIQTAILNATEDDCIVIAGKGHEDYQEINGERINFSDSQVVIDTLKMRV